MPIFTASLGSLKCHHTILSRFFTTDSSRTRSSSIYSLPHNRCCFSKFSQKLYLKRASCNTANVSVSVSEDAKTHDSEEAAAAGSLDDSSASSEAIREDRLSPSHSCKEPEKTIQEIAKGLTGLLISVKVIQADEENKRLIFSEREAVWSKFSKQINVGDIFEARVGSVEDYGAFAHLRFPDGLHHLTGLVHISEVSWDLVQDTRDILTEGNEVRVKVLDIDRKKSRIKLSIKQLEEDPLLETLDKVISQNGLVSPDSLSMSSSSNIEPLPGLGEIFEELLQEDGIDEVTINRQGFEKRVVSQDLQLWLSNAPPIDKKFTLLARAGRQVQEIQLSTSLDQEGIKKALQRVLERVP